jgi:hypothetical protein
MPNADLRVAVEGMAKAQTFSETLIVAIVFVPSFTVTTPE